MKAYERLLNYVVVRTPSDENSETVPSSTCQFDLARLLEAEMKELGLTDVILDDQCYLYGKLPATEGLLCLRKAAGDAGARGCHKAGAHRTHGYRIRLL